MITAGSEFSEMKKKSNLQLGLFSHVSSCEPPVWGKKKKKEHLKSQTAVQILSDQHIRQFQHAILRRVFKHLDSLCSQGNDISTLEPGHTKYDQVFFLLSGLAGKEHRLQFLKSQNTGLEDYREQKLAFIHRSVCLSQERGFAITYSTVKCTVVICVYHHVHTDRLGTLLITSDLLVFLTEATASLYGLFSSTSHSQKASTILYMVLECP